MSSLLLAKAVLASIESTTPPTRSGWSPRSRRRDSANLRLLFIWVPAVLVILILLLNLLSR